MTKRSESEGSVLVSACLLGRACRYDGRSKASASVAEQVAAWRAAGVRIVPVCPEELGGLGTPRPAAELRGGDGAAVLAGTARVVRVDDGADVTAAFVAGARAAWAQAPDAREAVLKARSPSCGAQRTYVDGRVVPGAGVFAALLAGAGVATRSDEQLP